MSSRKLRRNKTHQPLVNAVHNILGKSKNIVNNTFAFFDDNKDISLEVDAGKTKYIFMSHQKNALQNRYKKLPNKPFKKYCKVHTSRNERNKLILR